MESSYLLLNGLRVHYQHWNVDGDGRPVVLLHGLARSSRHWERTARSLAEAGLAVYALDWRGHGQTDDPPGDYGIAAFANDLLAFCTSLDLAQPVLAGHSLGASAALDYAARFSIGPWAPAAVVFVDGGLTQWFDRLAWEEMLRHFSPPNLAGMALEDYLAQLNHPARKWHPDESSIQAILSDFNVKVDETILPRVAFEQQVEMLQAFYTYPAYARFRQVRCPALMVAARFPEPYTPAEKISMSAKQAGLEQAQADMPGLQVLWMDDTSHHIPLQRPYKLGHAMIDFLQANRLLSER